MSSSLYNADNRSLRRAAEQLNVSQPAISRSLRVPEEAVGYTLLKRQPYGVVLTPQGRILRDFVVTIEEETGRATRLFESARQDVAGTLSVGTYESIAIYFWPGFLKTFATMYPKLSLLLRKGGIQDRRSFVERFDIADSASAGGF